jgi:hypothetical protein
MLKLTGFDDNARIYIRANESKDAARLWFSSQLKGVINMSKSIVSFLLLLYSGVLFAATYTYQGLNHQTTAGPEYTTQMQIIGHLTFIDLLPADSMVADVQVLDFSFDDGVQTLNSDNAVLVVNALTTDEFGMPMIWDLVVTATPLPAVVDDTVSQITLRRAINTEGFEVSAVGLSEPCVAVTQSGCLPAINSNFGSSFQIPGVASFWSLSSGSTTAVPMLSTGAFWLLTGLILLLVNHRLNSTRFNR